MREEYTDIEIDISNVCNLSCPLCHRENGTEEAYDLNGKHMSPETIKIIIEKFPNLQRFYLGFLICEPTLHPKFIEIVKIIKDAGKFITLSTNGNTYASQKERDHKFWNDFLSLLKPEDRIIWPVDGFNDEIYQKYRKGGSLLKVLFNIERATTIRPDVNHVIQTIIFSHNKAQIDELYHDFKEMYKFRFNLPEWSLIDCCGDCSLNSDEVTPTWDKEAWRKLRANPPKSPNFRCESRDNKIVFVDHAGRIGFCPTQLTNSVMVAKATNVSNTANVMDPVFDIDKYIDSCYKNRAKNKVCQFNCGTLSKLKKKKYNLDGIHTK